MADRSTISQLVQIGLEVTPGVAVPATRQLMSVSIEPSIKADIKEFAPMGFKYNTIDAEGKEFTEAAVKGFGNYNELIYPLASVLTTPPAPIAVGTGGQQWTFNPNSSNPDTPTTFTVEHGNTSVVADKFSYGIFTGLTLTFNRDAVEMSGSMMGQLFSSGITMTTLGTNEVQTLTTTGTPTGGTFTLTFNGQTTAGIAFNAAASAVQTALVALSTIGAGNVVCAGGPLPTGVTITFQGQLAATDVSTITANSAGLTGGASPTAVITTTTPGASGQLPIQPILGNQLDIFLDTTPGALGTTKLLRAFSGQIGLTNRFAPVWPLNTANPSFAAHVERKITAEARLMVEADTTGMQFLTSYLRPGATAFVRLQATGPALGASNYQLRWDGAWKVRQPSAFRDDGGVYAIEWTFDIVHDPTWGRSQQVTVINTTAAL